jgi:hypothetical protein
LARTLELGAASAGASDAQVVVQERRLNAFEASLRRQLAGSMAAPAGQRVAPSRAPRIEYVRPNPIVVASSTAGHEYESDEDGHEQGQALEHEGGAGDD